MTLLRVGDTTFDITPSLGPSSGSVPIQPVTSFGSAAGQFDIDLAGASCSMVVLGHSPEASVIDELVTDLWLLGDFPMRYRVWAVWQDFDEHGDDRISFQGVTYERLMNRRLIGAGGLLLNNTDVGTILWNAIQHTQAKTGGDLGMTQGDTTTGITTSVDWLPGENIGTRLEEMMKAHGCYWWVDENKAVHVYVRDNTTPIAEPVMWGVNVRHLQRASSGVGFSNSVYGSGSPETTPLFATRPDIATDPRRLWESAVARPEEVLQAELDDAVNGELNLRYQGLSRWNVTYVTEHWVGAARIRPGDRATLIKPPTLAGPSSPPPLSFFEDWATLWHPKVALPFDGDYLTDYGDGGGGLPTPSPVPTFTEGFHGRSAISTHTSQTGGVLDGNATVQSVTMLVYVPPSPTEEAGLWSKGGSTNGQYMYLESGVITARHRTSSTNRDILTAPIAVGWHTVGTKFDNAAGTNSLYIDGVKVNSVTTVTSPLNGTTDPVIGDNNVAGIITPIDGTGILISHFVWDDSVQPDEFFASYHRSATARADAVQVECISMSLQFDGDGGLEVKAVMEELPI